MRRSEEINELAKALATAQAELKAATKDASNPYFKSKYATLEAVIEAIKPVFSKNGLAYTQLIDSDEDFHYLETMVIHTSGQFVSSRVRLELSKKDMQAFGSSVTYARRYSLQAIGGISAEDDDDGNAAVTPSGKPTTAKPQAKKVPAGGKTETILNLAKEVFSNKNGFTELLQKNFGVTDPAELSAVKQEMLIKHLNQKIDEKNA